MNRFLVTLVGSFSLLACGGAAAADPLPWYASAKLGVSLPGTVESTSTTGFGVGGSGKSTFDAGFAGAFAVGKYISPQVRAELELALASNAGRSFTGTDAFGNPSSGSLSGNVTTTSVMIGAAYDFTQFGDFVPYLAGGLGAANVRSNLTFTDTVGWSSGTITGDSTVLAARVGAGFEYKLTDKFSVTGDYAAYFGGETSFTHTGAFGMTSTVKSSFMAHSAAVGLKANF